MGEVTHRWIVYGAYEGGLGIAFARQRLSRGGVFVDSGANIGQWLLYLGDIDGLRAFEFEPVRSQREWLEESVARQSHWTSACRVLPFGLGSSEGSVDIQCDGPRSTTRMDWFKNKGLAVEKIRLGRLDDFMDAAGVAAVDFWKLDVEGAEFEAMRGAKRLIAEQRVRAIYFECNPDNYSSCRQLLVESRYALFVFRKRRLERLDSERIASTLDIVALPQ